MNDDWIDILVIRGDNELSSHPVRLFNLVNRGIDRIIVIIEQRPLIYSSDRHFHINKLHLRRAPRRALRKCLLTQEDLKFHYRRIVRGDIDSFGISSNDYSLPFFFYLPQSGTV